MNKRYRANENEIRRLKNNLKSNTDKIINGHQSTKNSVESKLTSVLSEYGSCSSISSTVREIQRLLIEADCDVRKLEQDTDDIVDGLDFTIKSTRQSEDEINNIIGGLNIFSGSKLGAVSGVVHTDSSSAKINNSSKLTNELLANSMIGEVPIDMPINEEKKTFNLLEQSTNKSPQINSAEDAQEYIDGLNRKWRAKQKYAHITSQEDAKEQIAKEQYEKLHPEEIAKRLKITEFESNIMKQFGFDERTASLMGDVYKGLEKAYSESSQKQLDWMFTRLIGGFSYGSDSYEWDIKVSLEKAGWDSTAGNMLGFTSEEDFFINKLGFTQEDYRYLRYKVRVQNQINSKEEPEYADRIKPTRYNSYKTSLELAYNRSLTNEEFIKLWNKQVNELYGHSDLAHQFITISSICATEVGKQGIVSTLSNGGNGRREDMAGWLGDATIGNPVSFGADDYIADLDAENITHIMQEKKLNFFDATNQYYLEVGKNYSRAEKFLEHTDLSYVVDQISIELGYAYTYNVDGWIPKMELYTYEQQIELIKKSSPDAYRFIKNLENKNNTLQPVEE